MRKTIELIIHILISAFVGLLMLVLAYSLPTDVISKNMPKSAEIIRNEGEYPVLSEWFRSTTDNHTDGLMLSEASEDTYSNPLEEALYASNSRVEDYSAAESIGMHYLDGMDYTRKETYPRYWHGYLIILKPLLMMFDLGGIRVLNTIGQIVLLMIVCYLLVKCDHKAYVISYLLAYLMLRPIALTRCLQFSSCYYIFLIACIVLMIAFRKGKLESRAWLVFLYAGIATAFFDYLTYPIATLGIPMVLFLLLENDKDNKTHFWNILRYGIIWGAGYGIMWALKWIIASVLTDENVIADAVGAFLQRTSTIGYGGTEHFSKITSITWNIKAFVYTPVSIVVFAFVIVQIVVGIRNHRITKASVIHVLPYIMVSLLPVIWYVATTNHSCFHTFFTNKGCVVSLMAVLFGLTRVCLEE